MTMVTAINLRPRTRTTKTNTTKAITTKDKNTSTVVMVKITDISSMETSMEPSTETVVTTMNQATTMLMPTTPTNKMAGTMRAISTAKATKMSTTMTSTMTRGPQLPASNPSMDRVAMGS